MGLVAAILGLAVLVMIHEAGHFFAARAVGMTPRKFYLGFGPPIVKTVRGGVEYGIGSIPLGGYVKIPGMNRPSPGDLAASLQPGRASVSARSWRGSTWRSRAATTTRPARRSPSSGREIGSSRIWQELEWSLAPDAYWRQATWRRLVAIAAGPAVNLVFAFVLFAVLFMVASTRDTNVIGRVVAGTPAASSGLRAGDQVLRVAGAAVTPKEIPAHIRATGGRPFRLLVVRNGKRVVVGPVRAKLSQGAYRIGIAIESRTGPGESVPAAAADSVRLTWSITSEHGARPRPPGHRPRHEPGLELGGHRPRVRAGVAPGPPRLPVRARSGQPRARPAEPAPGPAARRRAHRDGAGREGARSHVRPGCLHALQRDRAVALRRAHVLRAAERPVRRGAERG